MAKRFSYPTGSEPHGPRLAVVPRADDSAAQSCLCDALLIEVSGVLYDDTAWWRWLVQLLGHLGVRTHFQAFHRLWEVSYLPRICGGEISFQEALCHYLHACGLTRGDCEEVLAAGLARQRLLAQRNHPYPGSRQTVMSMQAAGITLLAVSNSPCSTDQLRHQLSILGLTRPFTLAFSAGSLGNVMESPSFYTAAVAAAQLEGQRVAFASRRGAFLDAAAQANLPTIAVAPVDNASADLVVDDLAQLPVRLQRPRPQLLAG